MSYTIEDLETLIVNVVGTENEWGECINCNAEVNEEGMCSTTDCCIREIKLKYLGSFNDLSAGQKSIILNRFIEAIQYDPNLADKYRQYIMGTVSNMNMPAIKDIL